MGNTVIKCPQCGHEFNLENSVRDEIEKQMKIKYDEKLSNKIKELNEEKQALKEQQQDLVKEINEKAQSLLKEKEKDLKLSIRNEIEHDKNEEIQELRGKIEEQRKQAKSLREKELEIEKLKERNENLRLEIETDIQKKYNEKLKDIDKTYKDKYEVESKQSEIAYKQQIDSMKKTIETLSKKIEQGSPKIQGEVQELLIEEELKTLFPDDEIEAVKSGKRGADIIHIIKEKGKVFGKIIWESKNATNFSSNWIEKIKEDGQKEKSDINIIITSIMPGNSQETTINEEGVWIVKVDSYKSLAVILRDQIIRLSKMKSSFKSQDENLQILYQYLTSSEFTNRISAIVSSFTEMKKELDDERTKIESLWAKREKQLQKVIKNYAGMYGDFKGLLGKELPVVKLLELE